jgi:cell division protein DivIC
MKLLTHIPSWLKSKYLLTAAGFLVWMLFFDRNDLFTQYSRFRHSKELQKNEARQTNQIADARKELELLKTNAQTIEEYAREKYMMKKDNEDLFIIKPSPENN